MANYTIRLRITADEPPVPVNTGTPTFTGTPAVGQTLTSTNGIWANSPTSYAYQHQSSVNGTDWTDIVGATSASLPVDAAYEGLYLRPGVLASNATGPAASYAYGVGVGPVTTAVSKLVPSAQWGVTGVAGSGFDTANPAAPVDPTRTTAKPMMQLLIVPRQAYGDDLDLIVNVRAKGGVAGVFGITEGGDEIEVTTPAFHIVTDANGNATTVYGYKFTLDHAATMALNALGRQRVYFRGVPSDGTMQERVIGPFEFSARNPGVGTGCVITKQLQCSPSLSDVADSRYSTIKKCLDRIKTQGWEFPEILFTETRDYPFQTAVTTESGPRDNWTILRADTGITATIGDGSANPPLAGLQWDGLCYRGSGVKWDLAKVSPSLAGHRLRTNSNKMLWFDGCEIFCGTNSYLSGSGSGMGALYEGLTSSGYWVSTQNGTTPTNLYFTDVNAHDLPGYGLSFCTLVRGGVQDGVGGSTLECVIGAAHRHVIRRVGGILSGLRTYLPAMTLAYTGAGAATWEITQNSGSGPLNGSNSTSRHFKLYVDGVAVLDYTMMKQSGLVTTVAQIVAAVNAVAGWSAVETSQPRAAVFLTLESLGTAGPVTLRSIGATPVQLTTWIDVHADALVFHDMTLQNAIFDFIEIEELVGGAMIGLNSNATVRDVWISQVTSHDTSLSYGFTGFSGGYISSATASHLVMEYMSQAGGVQSFTTTFTPDAYCLINHCHFTALGWSTRGSGIYPDLDIQSLSLPGNTLALPVGSDANSKLQPLGLDDGNFFTDLSDPANPDFRPLSPLQLDDLTYAGALEVSTGAWQGV